MTAANCGKEELTDGRSNGLGSTIELVLVWLASQGLEDGGSQEQAAGVGKLMHGLECGQARAHMCSCLSTQLKGEHIGKAKLLRQ